MIYPDVIFEYELIEGTKTVYREVSKKGASYGSIGTPQVKKRPNTNVITISANRVNGINKPDYRVYSGDGNYITGIFYDPVSEKGYGDIGSKDVLLFDWDMDHGKIKIQVLVGKSEGRTQNTHWFNHWLKGHIKDQVLFNRLPLGTNPETPDVA